jgi:tRNA-dihydrouridine synthase B
MRDQLFLAPLQGFTDRHFRNAFQQCYGDVDRFFAPYLKMKTDGTIKEHTKLDVLQVNNPFEQVVPQVMACCSADFLLMAQYLKEQEYKELNWNLGCPYPMVAKQDLGSGILNKPDKLFAILDEVIPKLDMDLGIKMRMGYEDTSDILNVLPRLNDYPLTEIIVHARYGKQLYNGPCDLDRFEESIALTKHKLVYNGDIRTVSDFRILKARFPKICHWMIGRGAISNPLLFEMIQDDTEDFPEDRMEVFHDFLILLLENQLSESDNEGNTLIKMKHFWEYFSESFENGLTYYRKIKRATSIEEYEEVIESICLQDN